MKERLVIQSKFATLKALLLHEDHVGRRQPQESPAESTQKEPGTRGVTTHRTQGSASLPAAPSACAREAQVPEGRPTISVPAQPPQAFS